MSTVDENELIDEISKLAASCTRYGLQVGRSALHSSAESLDRVARLLTELAERLRHDYL